LVPLDSRKKRGFNAERELLENLKDLGFWGARIPVSGVGQPLPDVIIFHNGVLFGFEVKSTNEDKKVFYKREFDNLVDWLKGMERENFKAEAWLAVRFKGGKWRFYRIFTSSDKVKCDPKEGFGIIDLSKEMRNIGRRLNRKFPR